MDQPETSTKETASAIITLDKNVQSSSTLKNKQKVKLKKIDLTTRPGDILDTFQNRNLAPADWENLADQLLKRGIQKVADKLRGQSQPSAEREEKFEPPQGASDDSRIEDAGVRRSSRQTKSKEPKRFGDPVKHSIKEVLDELTGGALLKAALQEYQRRLTEFKERNDRPTVSKLRLLEKRLFRRKFGYATLDKEVDWNPSWRIDLDKN